MGNVLPGHNSLVLVQIEALFVLMPVAFEGLHVYMYVICNYMMYTTEIKYAIVLVHNFV